MKIVVLSSHTPSLIWFRMDMMKAFLKEGCEVVAVGNEPAEKWRSTFKEANIKYHPIKVNRNGMNPFADIITLFSIMRMLLQERPDIIFAYHAKTVIYGCIAARIMGVKKVFALIAGIGSVFNAKGVDNKFIRAVLCLEYRIALHICNTVFFQNKDDSDVFTSKRLVSKNKVVHINGSGVNLQNFIPTPLPENPAFLFIGRLIKDKGILEYLEACRTVKAKNKSIRCLLVGPYDTNPTALTPKDIQKYTEDNTVEYYGEQQDVRPYISQCSIYVLPSYREGTPKTILEAMACGRAIITTNAPGCRETVIDGQNGFIVPVMNTEALVEKMLFLADNRELVIKMGQISRSIVEKKYDVEGVNAIILSAMGLVIQGDK